MAVQTYATRPGTLPEGTLVDLLLGTVDRLADLPAYRLFTGHGPHLETVTYRALFAAVKEAVGVLRAASLQRGDRAAILSENRFEWALVDQACLLEGVWDVPIHSVLTADQVAYILRDCGARVVFVSREQAEKAREAVRLSGGTTRIVSFDDAGSDGEILAWSALRDEGRARMAEVGDEALRASARSATPDDVATVLYTSGTTGNPKGVVLTHRNLFSNVQAAGSLLAIDATDRTLSFLPLSHVFQRMVDYLLLSRGCALSYPHTKDTLPADLVAVQPSVLVAVPRVYEKIYGAVMSRRGVQGRIVRWAREVALAWSAERLEGRTPTLPLRLAHGLADALVFSKLRERVGGRVRFFVSGSAPLEPEIARFFHAAGMPILEGYGLTETSPVICVNTPDELRVGTVGRPLPQTEVRIADDGEILARGPQVMKGYFNLPEETASAIDAEGWFRTGDIGELDAQGYLRITDRKKDLIKTSGGKYVAPQPIENRIKRSPLVDQVTMIGDRRKFAVLLVVPDFPALEAWAREQGIRVASREALVADARVQERMRGEVLTGLDDFSHVEIPQKMALLTKPFSIEDGTLTLTDKVKRRVVQERYAALIDRFFLPENEDEVVFVE